MAETRAPETTRANPEQVGHWFTYHTPQACQIMPLAQVRDQAREFASLPLLGVKRHDVEFSRGLPWPACQRNSYHSATSDSR